MVAPSAGGLNKAVPQAKSAALKSDDFCLIVAVDNDEILSECLLRSPDVASGALTITEIRGASNMADAYNQGLARTMRPICVFTHQDVYLPQGWLERAVAVLNGLSESAPGWMVAGPYGVRPNGEHVGRVWDVTMGKELGSSGFAPAEVGSFDELVLILRREPGFQFDPDLPYFHLYGTDLAQAAIAAGRTAWAVELPVVHNNRPIVSLGGGYREAYHYARKKWRAKLPIPTSICSLSNNPLALWRAQWRRRKVKSRGLCLQADAQDIARQAGYEDP